MSKYLATLKWGVDGSWDNQLLRLFLRDYCQISKRALADIKFNGGLLLQNGNEVTVRTLIKEGDEITVCLPQEKASSSLQPENLELDIVFEDEHLLVINKVAGMPTIPSREHPVHTLANAVLGYYVKKSICATFHAVNRLDKDTSGLLIVAKHRLAHDRLSKLQQEGLLNRFYTAIVMGRIKEGKGTINAPIGRMSNSIITREVRTDGKRAITHYIVRSISDHMTVVDIKLETGRTHQIRVHFSYLGHSLLGDELYGGRRDIMNRQALHCGHIQFQHPFSHRTITVTKGLPADMQNVLKKY
ncbi:RluA family pseudouridine synthase [Halalkalibacter kiskunsagensis]|uniref:Pseudouridine synthase n=1 Tax=Halalkalibacter kiskunsagensis TaxID=1548599 RepID=A0ABV6K888_9BACI